MGKKIIQMQGKLQSASGNAACIDQKNGLKAIAERLGVKKIRIDHGAALFYGKTVFDVEVFVHVKRTSESAINVEIKCVEKELAKALVDLAVHAVKKIALKNMEN